MRSALKAACSNSRSLASFCLAALWASDLKLWNKFHINLILKIMLFWYFYLISKNNFPRSQSTYFFRWVKERISESRSRKFTNVIVRAETGLSFFSVTRLIMNLEQKICKKILFLTLYFLFQTTRTLRILRINTINLRYKKCITDNCSTSGCTRSGHVTIYGLKTTMVDIDMFFPDA